MFKVLQVVSSCFSIFLRVTADLSDVAAYSKLLQIVFCSRDCFIVSRLFTVAEGLF